MRVLRYATCLLFIMLLAAPSGAQDYPKISLTFGHFTPATPPHAQVDQWFVEELARRSGGNITMKIFWAESMGKSRELLNLVGQGAVDVAATPASYFPTQLPFLSAPSSMPLTLDSNRQGHVVMHTLWQDVPTMQEEARKANVYPLFFHVLNPYHLICAKPVRTLDDLKGKKLRSWGEDMPRAWQAIGAVPVTVLPGDFYESLQRGSIDCMLLPWDLIVAFKLHEVAKHGLAINLGAVVSNPQWYNLAKWQSFPPQVKKLFTDLAEEARKRDAAKAEEAERSALDTMKAAGVEIIPFADQAKFEKAMPDFLADWTMKMEKLGKGPEATAMVKRWKELRAQTK